jgi:hypothetical protein
LLDVLLAQAAADPAALLEEDKEVAGLRAGLASQRELLQAAVGLLSAHSM